MLRRPFDIPKKQCIMRKNKINVTFAFRHKWDNDDGLKYNSEFKDYRVGFWFRKNRIVGSKRY